MDGRAGNWLGVRFWPVPAAATPSVWIERGIDFNGRMAGDGGRNPRTKCRKILIPLRFSGVGAALLNHLGKHPLQSRSLQADRSSFHRKCLWAKGFHLKSVPVQLLGDLREDHHLPGLQFHQHGHQQSLALHLFHLPIAKNFFKKNSFVGHMLGR